MTEIRTGVLKLRSEAQRRFVLDDELFRERTSALGARTDPQRCAVAGISRASLNRYRRGTVAPSLPALTRMAERLNVARDRLFREVVA